MQFATSCTAHFCHTSFTSVGQLLAAAHTSLMGQLWTTCCALRMHQEMSGSCLGSTGSAVHLDFTTQGTAELLVPPWAHQAASGSQDSSTSYFSVFKPWPLILWAQCEISEHSPQKVELKQQLLVLDSGKKRIHSWDCSAPLQGQWTVSLGSRPFPHDTFL